MSITDPLIGCQLGDYRIVDLLGRGGMARVYRGYDEKLDRYAAVKVIDAHLADESEDEYRERFLREARAIARLSHPNIVGVYQFGQVESAYYMAMAFVDGRDLGQILRAYAQQGRLMAYRDILRVARDIASALDHAHAGGVIHRDIKPSNIMITVDGRAVLTDFGLALSVREGSQGNTFGSAHYIAPEQALSSASAVPQSDFYALGVVLYQMLVGRVPFDDPSATAVALKHLREPPPPPRQVNPDIPPPVEAVILRMLEKDPARRFKNGRAMLRALERAFALAARGDLALRRAPELAAVAADGLPFSVTRPTAPPKPPLPAARRAGRGLLMTLIVIATVLAALIVGAGAILMIVGATPVVPTGTLVLAVATATRATPTRPPASETAVPPPAEAPQAGDPAVSESAATAALAATPSATSTASPTVTPTAPTATPTPSLSHTLTATPTARPTRTPVPTDTPPPAVPDRGAVLLRYDDAMLVVWNPTADHVNVADLQFVQAVGERDPLIFRSNMWRSASALEPGSCFQVWTDRYLELPLPAYCAERQSWQAVSFVRWFWLSDDPDAEFEVRRGDTLLARCAIAAGECLLRLDNLG